MMRLIHPRLLLLIQPNNLVNKQRECVCLHLGEADVATALQAISLILAGIAFQSW